LWRNELGEFKKVLKAVKSLIKDLRCSDISGSRQIKDGFLFFAYQGNKLDGHSFIHSAVENGAAAVAPRGGNRPETSRFSL